MKWLRDCLRKTAARMPNGEALRPDWLSRARLGDFEQSFAAAVRAADLDGIDRVAADWIRFQPDNPVPYLVRTCAAASLPKKGDATIRRMIGEFEQRFAALPAKGGDGRGQDEVMADLERYDILTAFRELGIEATRFDARFFKKHRSVLLYVYPQRQNIDQKRRGVARRLDERLATVDATRATIQKYEQNITKLRRQAQRAPRSSRSSFLNEARYLSGRLKTKRSSLPKAEAKARDVQLELERIDTCLLRMRDMTIR